VDVKGRKTSRGAKQTALTGGGATDTSQRHSSSSVSQLQPAASVDVKGRKTSRGAKQTALTGTWSETSSNSLDMEGGKPTQTWSELSEDL
jgi:hypothetical protein